MRRLMVFDCENVSPTNHLDEIASLKNWDVVLILGHGQALKPQSIKVLEDLDFVTFERATTTGKNAADFVVVSAITERLAKNKYLSGCIISNDKGFESSVTYLKQKGYKINLYSLKMFLKNFKKDVSPTYITSNPGVKEIVSPLLLSTKHAMKENITTINALLKQENKKKKSNKNSSNPAFQDILRVRTMVYSVAVKAEKSPSKSLQEIAKDLRQQPHG